MHRRLTYAPCSLLVALLPLAGGCGVIGTLLVPGHGLSQAEARPLRVVVAPPRVAPEFAAPGLAPIAAELIAGAIVQGIEAEAERYDATDSARAIAELRDGASVFVIRCASGVEIGGERPRCVNDGEEPQLFFEASVALQGGGLSLQVQEYRVNAVKAKVAHPSFQPPRPFRLGSFWPLHWPASLVLLPWQLVDEDIGKIDVNVQLKIEALAERKESGFLMSPLGALDFPFEGASLPDRMDPDARGAIASPLIALPAAADRVTVNLTAIVAESNDLGDVIAKGAEEAKKREGDLRSRLQDLLGGGSS